MTDKTWQAQVDTFLADFSSDRTKQRYGAALEEFRAWYEKTYAEEPTIERVTDRELRRWRDALGRRGLKPATVNLRLSAVRSFARKQGHNLRVENVREQIKPVEPLDPAEIRKLLRALDGDSWESKRDVAIVYLLAGAGLRVSEVVHLQVEDVRISPRKGTARIREGKGRKTREVKLGKDVREALREYLAERPEAPDSTLFVSRNRHKPLRARDVQRIVQRGARVALLDDDLTITPHILRHSYASRFIAKNPGEIATLQMQLGHRSLRSTWRYMHPTGAEVQEMVENLWE